MNTEKKNPIREADEIQFAGYKESPRPQSGRFVFGPWCLLGVWPVVFGVVEKTEQQKQETE